MTREPAPNRLHDWTWSMNNGCIDKDGNVRNRFERGAMAWPPEPWDAPNDAQANAPCDALGQAFEGPSDRASGDRASGVDAGLVREVLQTLTLALVIFMGARVVVQNFIVENVSMEPTLIGGQHIWVDKILYRLSGGPSRGDIVVFQSWNQDKPFVKRVVGLPGEKIEFRGGDVLVDGVAVAEPYLSVSTDGPSGPFSLGSDEFFVMGDNRSRSGDSRNYGPLDGADLIGKAWLRYWPPDEISLLSGATRPLFASDP